MAKRRNVTPPRPDLIRQPQGRFGWLDDRLLREGWLGRLGPDATSVLVLLALAADRHGASFYGRDRMANELSISRQAVDLALSRLMQLHLVDHRPWRPGQADGVWQLLPVPHRSGPPRGGQAAVLGDLLKSLELDPRPA